MNNGQRMASYLKGREATGKLTPAQRRRARKKYRQSRKRSDESSRDEMRIKP